MKITRKGAKLLAIMCALCMLCSIIPCAVSAENNITVEITDVAKDIVTVSGKAPVDAMVSIKILNPGVDVSDTTDADIEKIQFFDVIFSDGGSFTRDIKMRTGKEPNKKEGLFTILVSIDGELVYSDNSFLFYSNETKMSYMADIKSGTAENLLQQVDENSKKIEKIFETFSLYDHELFKAADKAVLANVICRQEIRKNIADTNQLKDFLVKALVLNAFESKSALLSSADGINYTEIWAADDKGVVSGLYTNDFENSLSAAGKEKVKAELFGADWKNAQFDDIFEKFESSIYFHLIKNNVKLGSAHIEKLVTDTYKEEYKAAGFDAELLTSITNSKEKLSKLDSVLECNAANLLALAQEFNSIMKAEYVEETLPEINGNSGSGGGGGGGGFGGGKPSNGAEGGSEDGGFVSGEEAETQKPEASHPFKDMEGATWAEEAVEYLYKEGIINGRSEDEFVPAATVTRAELVKMICQALSVEEAENAENFSDVKEDDWFAAYVKNAAAAGIIKGDGGAFNPNGGVTREDAALIISRALGLGAGGDIAFSDKAEVSDYAVEAISAMVNAGLIKGMGDGTFAPKATLTRAQAAQLIYNAIKGGTGK